MIKVRKYNKKLQPFDTNKIVESIKQAVENSGQQMPETKMVKIAETMENELTINDVKIVSTDEIATFVEKALMNSSYKDVAKAFITYRHDKQQEHVYNSDLIKAFKKKLNGVNIENANANSDERSFSGRMHEASRVLFKDDALNTMSKTHKNNHINNRSYTHDLDSYSAGLHNCLSIPFDNLFKNGVAIKQTDLRRPKSIGTAMQLIAVFMQIQSLQQFGGVSATHIDWTLVPYVRYSLIKNLAEYISYDKDLEDEDAIVAGIHTRLFIMNKVAYAVLNNKEHDKELFNILSDNSIDFIDMLNKITIEIMVAEDDGKITRQLKQAIKKTTKDTKQGAEGLIHNLNSLQSRSGQQLPFSSINYGTNTSFEGRMITNAILDAELDGTGPLHKTPIFPCCIFQYEENINGVPDTPNYDLFKKSLYCTTKRLYPNYCNVNWSVDLANRQKDINHKKEVLSKISEDNMKKLVSWCKANTKEAIQYRMKVIDDKVVIDEKVIVPVEIMSTMGKCKCSSSKIF